MSKQVIIDPTWITIQLPHGWQIHTPKGFKMKELQGIDSRVGYVYSEKDSIKLAFDCGRMMTLKPCDFQADLHSAKQYVDTGGYHLPYDTTTNYKAKIDTIDGNIAVIVHSTYGSAGRVRISLTNCTTKTWLGLGGERVPQNKQQMVFDIFKTIRNTGDR